jgi:superfamily II DNA helicase RecQ
MAALRETYSELHDLRSLVNSVNIIALTAKATVETTETIMDVLLMEKPHFISELPNKPNIAYSVSYMPKDKSLGKTNYWLVEEILEYKH